MKGVSLFVSVLSFILLEVIYNGEATYSSVIISNQGTFYQLDSLKNIEQKLKNPVRNDVANGTLRIIKCCPKGELNKSSKLFIQKITENASEIQDLSRCDIECKPSIRPSSVNPNNTNISEYNIGYEVCDPEKKLKEHKLISFAKECEFFSNLKIAFNKDSYITKEVKYELIGSASSNERVEETCTKFITDDDDDDVIKAVHNKLRDLYSKEQNKTFKNNTYGETTEASLWNKKEKDEDFLVPQLLAVREHFQNESLALTTCYYINTVAMWKSRVPAWRHRQNFIQKVADEVGKLTIWSGTQGVLKVKYSSDDDENKELYLDPESNSVPVPEKLWTVVRYYIPAKPQTLYGMILVTSYSQYGNERVCADEPINCEKVFWNDMNIDKRLHTHCCSFTNTNLQHLEVDMYVDENTTLENFNLKMVIVGENENGFLTKDVVSEIRKKSPVRNGPLALYIAEDYYKLESLNEIKKNLPNSMNANSRNPVDMGLSKMVPKAVLCCSFDTTDDINSEEEFFQKNSHFVSKLIRTRAELTNSDSFCKNKLQPSINEASEPAMNFITDPPTSIVNLQSGYWVCDRNGILEKNSLKPFKNNRKCDFFSTMRILFDKSKSIARQVRYDINIEEQLFIHIIEKCGNFNVGIANLTNGNDINEAYEKHIQDEALHNTWERIPIAVEVHDVSHPLLPGKICGVLIVGGAQNRNELSQNERDYFIPQPLAPTFHFGDNSLAFTVCSLQNTAPMWDEIAKDAWMPMQKFVQYIAKKIGKKLSIITGTKDTLELPEYNSDPSVCSKRTIKLGRAEVAVPREFWTVVMYHFTGEDADMASKTYGMILVVNNDKLSEIKNGCQVVDCQLNGWPKEKTPFNFKQSYCCKFTKNNLDYFNIKISELTEELLDLNLKKVPIKEENSNKLSWVNLVNQNEEY